MNKHGEVKRVKLTQGSGQYALDQQVLAAVKAACIFIDIVISYHYTQIVEFGVLLKS